jgi:hypothetical protein
MADLGQLMRLLQLEYTDILLSFTCLSFTNSERATYKHPYVTSHSYLNILIKCSYERQFAVCFRTNRDACRFVGSDTATR